MKVRPHKVILATTRFTQSHEGVELQYFCESWIGPSSFNFDVSETPSSMFKKTGMLEGAVQFFLVSSKA